MEDFYRNMSQNNSYHDNQVDDITVVSRIIFSICLPLIILTIYSLYSQVQNDHVAPIYIINLLISDLLQLCSLIVIMANPEKEIYEIFYNIHDFGLLASVGFMVCVALERYLVIAWPLWYRFRRTIKSSLVVCFVVWTLPLVYVLPVHFWVEFEVAKTIFAIFLLIPFPLLIFFLGGTLKALSASHVPSDEKRRIVGIVVLVLLIYMLLFLPRVIWFLAKQARYNKTLSKLSLTLIMFSPLADMILYVFVRKGTIDKLLASLCCCRMDSNDNSRSSA